MLIDPSNYRGIQVGSIVCKIFVILLINRIQEWYNSQILDFQNGFRSGRSTCDGIYILKQTQITAEKTEKQIYVAFIDLTAAFDHVNRSWLIQSIRNRLSHHHRNNKIVNLFEALYRFSTTELKGDPQISFETRSGVRQGGAESPMLFNLYLDYVLRVYLNNCMKTNIKFHQLQYRINDAARINKRDKDYKGNFVNVGSAYADDVALLFEDTDNLQQGLHILNKTFEEFGLTINKFKTKTMILNFRSNTAYPSTICSVGGTNIDNVETFTYLGQKINFRQTNVGEEEICNQIHSATAAFQQHKHLLRNFKIFLKSRVLFLNAFVRSRLTYECSTWTTTDAQMRRLDACYRMFLRKIMKQGYTRTSTQSFKITNSQLHQICKTTDLSDFMTIYDAHLKLSTQLY